MVFEVDGFLDDEDGAVTVDWVVLTVALVGLGLAAMTVIRQGTAEQSGDIALALRGADPAAGFATEGRAPVTAALNPSAAIEAGRRFDTLNNVRQFAFRLDAALRPEDEGILFEAGGRIHGTVLYQHDGRLYLQSGSGAAAGRADNRGEAVWDVRAGRYSIEGSLDADRGLTLYVDGQEIARSDFQHDFLAGGNDGSVGQGYGGVARNRGGFTRHDGHSGAGTLTIFRDQSVPSG